MNAKFKLNSLQFDYYWLVGHAGICQVKRDEAEKYGKKRESERSPLAWGAKRTNQIMTLLGEKIGKVMPDSQWNCWPKGATVR